MVDAPHGVSSFAELPNSRFSRERTDRSGCPAHLSYRATTTLRDSFASPLSERRK